MPDVNIDADADANADLYLRYAHQPQSKVHSLSIAYLTNLNLPAKLFFFL
jgi:hypothetical protein